ncbi:hypothetical protein C5167_048167 [Papaver somniferum]|uniref:UBC core domain-containing protein n=1 Tax=Papaver somniferum TaxID=3469 RepID=A0A4Y7KKR8_PAPSO|nr:hypothetical protein C5167_048167 [Papaver somniferum]
MSSPSKRREMDLMKLMMSDYKVEMINDGMQEFYVDFTGPTDSPYHGGVWRIRVELPDAYPYKSPSIDLESNVWYVSLLQKCKCVYFGILFVFHVEVLLAVFLPQLLLYPNPSDPLNGEAAALMMRDKAAYEQRVKEYCEKYAKPEDVGNNTDEKSSDEEDEASDNDYDSSDEGMAGHADP